MNPIINYVYNRIENLFHSGLLEKEGRKYLKKNFEEYEKLKEEDVNKILFFLNAKEIDFRDIFDIRIIEVLSIVFHEELLRRISFIKYKGENEAKFTIEHFHLIKGTILIGPNINFEKHWQLLPLINSNLKLLTGDNHFIFNNIKDEFELPTSLVSKIKEKINSKEYHTSTHMIGNISEELSKFNKIDSMLIDKLILSFT